MDASTVNSKKPVTGNNAVAYCSITEKIPMHPDDFNGLLAWIMAKQHNEKIPENYSADKYRLLPIMR
jgi:hypothetical protein